MKYPTRLLLSLLIQLYTVFSASSVETDTILAEFANPPREYSTMPLWVWNDVVTKEKIDRDLEAFHKANIYGAFVHPRPGLITEYLSDEWFELWDHAKQRADELGMELWIYDENSFPSGFGGGHVANEMPESVASPTSITMAKLEKHNAGSKPVPDMMVEIVQDNRMHADGDLIDVETDAIYGFNFHRESPNGWYGGGRYVDLLIPGVTETFIDVTMRGYEAQFGKELGSTIPGVFTDEPNIRPYGSNGIRFTPSLWEDFESRWGYDLRLHLPSLFDEVGDWRRVRHNYYNLLLELFIERWSKPWFEYTERMGLQWTGHYWEHGWPNPTHGGDNMAMYAWHQMPGIDMLFNNQQRRPDQFGNVRAVKELSSVANQLGRKRTLSETYGGAGWDLSFEEMKRLGDWQAALGVNFMNQHLSYMTLKGRRKGDFPQSFSYHAPYWNDYGILAKYFHRLSYALSQGEQINRILVVEPTTSAWMYYSPQYKSAYLDGLKTRFEHLLNTLEDLQIEYDLASENIMKDHGRISGDSWVVGEREYEVVLLPEFCESIDHSTYEQLEAYLQNGGRLIAAGELPTRIDGKEADLLDALFERHKDQAEILRGEVRPFTIQKLELQSDGFRPGNPPSYGGEVYHMHRILADGQLFFFSNFSKDETARVVFEADGRSAYLLNLFDGNAEPFPIELDGNTIKISETLPPAGSVLLLVSNRLPASKDFSRSRSVRNWVPVPAETTAISAGPNVLTIDFVDLELNGQLHEGIYFADAANLAYEKNGLEKYGRFGYNPWAVAVQYKTNILDMSERFDEDSGFKVSYPIVLADGFMPDSLKAVVEWPHLYEISINGVAVDPIEDEWWLDKSFGVIDLTPHLKSGRNTIELEVYPMNIHAEIEPVFVLGDFSIKPATEGFIISPPEILKLGSWAKQGRGMYSDTVAYTKSLHAESEGQYKVQLGAWNGTLARVRVNGNLAGHIFHQPYELDISDFIHQGTNTVTVEVVGSLKGVLGPHHRDQEPGLVTPWSWMIGPAEQPTGENYHLPDYGLLEDYLILMGTDSPH